MLKKILQHCGLDSNIGEESFPVNYFPVPERYIVYQTGSEKKSQVYDLSPEVLVLIGDILNQAGVHVIQVGDSDDPKVQSSLDLRGQISVRQLAYIIKNSLLCVTSNKLSTKLCRVFKKNVILMGSNFPSTKIVDNFPGLTYIEPELTTERWTYKEEENPKLINSIKPEDIGVLILKKLGINIQSKFKTLFVGEKFGPQIVDLIPDGPIPEDLNNKLLNIRLDVLFRPEAVELLSHHKEIFITTKEGFNLSNVNCKNVKTISYFCDNDPDINFIKSCFKKNVVIYVISSSEENLNNLRFKLLGICEVYKKIKQKELDFSNFSDILFKSSRFYVGRGKVYPSLYHYKNDLQTNIYSTPVDESFINNEDFLESKESMYFFTV